MGDVLLGASFPGNAVGMTSRAEIDDWLGAVVEAGFDYVSVGDHVLGVDANGLSPTRIEQWNRHYPGVTSKSPYDHRVVFREPMVLLTYIAATTALGIATGLLVSPQRQTALIAKQAADVDLLSGGRLRLGLGVGWNAVEYGGMGAPFHARQDLLEEQIGLLRRFWTEPIVDFAGRFHTVEASGIQLLPGRLIPIWIGGDGPRSLDRIGRLADGWQPPGRVTAGPDAQGRWDTIRRAAEQAGRDPDTIGVEARLFISRYGSAAQIKDFVDSWRPYGMTHLVVEFRQADPSVPVSTYAQLLQRMPRDVL